MKTIKKNGKLEPAAKKATGVIQAPKSEKYFSGIGRRKSATASIRLYPQKRGTEKPYDLTVNKKDYLTYFPLVKLQEVSVSPLNVLNLQNRFKITVLTAGGGIAAQAEAVRLGIARTLIAINPLFKKPLKRAGFLTRDPRKKERKKPGLKKARRAPQWQKR